MKKTIYLISIVFLSNSCNYQENIREKNTYEITSLIIENTGGPIKPPPPPNGQKSRFTKNQIDSIMMRIQKVALFPVFYKVKRDFSKNAKIEDEYNKLVSDFGTIEKEEFIDLSKIRTSKHLKLSKIDTIKLKSEKRYVDKNYDILIYFSEISFNEEYDKAALIVGSTRGHLNGSNSIVYMHKVNNVWMIKNVKFLEIS